MRLPLWFLETRLVLPVGLAVGLSGLVEFDPAADGIGGGLVLGRVKGDGFVGCFDRLRELAGIGKCDRVGVEELWLFLLVIWQRRWVRAMASSGERRFASGWLARIQARLLAASISFGADLSVLR